MMAFYGRLLGASITIIIFTSKPVQHVSAFNARDLHLNRLFSISNNSTNIHKLQTEENRESAFDIFTNKTNFTEVAGGKDDVRTKRSSNHNHIGHHSNHVQNDCLISQITVPRENQSHLQIQIENWITVLSLLDNLNITLCEQITNNLYIGPDRRNWAQWSVVSSRPKNYMSNYENRGLKVATCAYSHRNSHEVYVNLSNNSYPIGCVHAHRISIEAKRKTDKIVTK